MIRSFALDLLGRQAWRIVNSPTGVGTATGCSKWLPSALLPLRRSEVFLHGVDIEAHRRGRGLAWPPESQVPVLNKPTCGMGRMPMAAVLEFLVCQEREWGKLEQTQVAWSPDGRDQVPIAIRHLLGQSLQQYVPEVGTAQAGVLGITVPSLLQPAGQQVVIDACQDKGMTALLVPTHMAAAIAWGHSPAAAPHLERATPGEGVHVGHLLIFEVGLGPWVALRVPIMAVREGGRRWLVPVRPARKHHVVLAGPTGWQAISAAAQHLGEDWLARMSQGPSLHGVLGGDEAVPHDACTIAIPPDASGVASLCGLETGRSGALRDLITAAQRIGSTSYTDEQGPCLGSLMVGAAAEVRVVDIPIRERLAKACGMAAQHMPPEALASGAAWAAHAFAQDPKQPTWRETLEPLDMYYIGKDSLGDPAQGWLPLIHARTVAAGTDYANEKPLRSLALESGFTRVRMTLRRARDDAPDDYEHRAVYTKTVDDFQNNARIPLEIHVHARAGHGLAVVRVTSADGGPFDTTLDWMTMTTVPAPAKPKLGYIPRSIEVRSEPNLYGNVYTALRDMQMALDRMLAWSTVRPQDRLPLGDVAKDVVKGLNRILSGKQISMVYKNNQSQDDFVYYAAIGRSGDVHPGCDATLATAVAEKAGQWIERNQSFSADTKRIRNMCAYFYLRCPAEVTNRAVHQAEAALRGRGTVDGADLRVLGLTTKTPHQFVTVYRLVTSILSKGRKANNYLRAVRDITRLNDDALSFTSLPAEVCAHLTTGLVEYLVWAEQTAKKQIISNCIESLLFMLKRRRYDGSYLSESDLDRLMVDTCLERLTASNSPPHKPWLPKNCLRNVERLTKFLSHQATDEDCIDPIDDGQPDDDDDD